MMDDVVGLVMVQVISNLGGDDFSWVTVVRPVLISVAFAVVAPLLCLFVAKPVTIWLNSYREAHPSARVNTLLQKPKTTFTIHTLVLVGLVTAATYAGTSNLFAAYIAGATISWWDSEVAHPVRQTSKSVGAAQGEKTVASTSGVGEGAPPILTTAADSDRIVTNTEVNQDSDLKHSRQSGPEEATHQTGGSAIYEHYYQPAVSKILQPFFFASVGFSIPITRMFRGAIVWRGVVYTMLMALGKLACGLWLVRIPTLSSKVRPGKLLSKVRLLSVPHLWGKSDHARPTAQAGATPTQRPQTSSTNAIKGDRRSSPNAQKPFSLHPPLILALAMCARGEIGFLISGVAESRGVFSANGKAADEPSDIFLVVTWAIVLCTIMGPLGVGLSVRRVKELQSRKDKEQDGAGRDVLGVWGVK